MTNKFALIFGAMLVALFALDYLVFGWGLPVFLGQKLAETIEWMAFWR